MGVYHIIFEVISDGNIVTKSHYIESPSFAKAALYAIEFEKQFQHPVKGLAFVFKLSDRIPVEQPKEGMENAETNDNQ